MLVAGRLARVSRAAQGAARLCPSRRLWGRTGFLLMQAVGSLQWHGVVGLTSGSCPHKPHDLHGVWRLLLFLATALPSPARAAGARQTTLPDQSREREFEELP